MGQVILGTYIPSQNPLQLVLVHGLSLKVHHGVVGYLHDRLRKVLVSP